jgi:hypothetical protein
MNHKYFPLLRSNILELRVCTIDETAKLLALHENDLHELDAKEELRQLKNDLICLTQYLVGAAFDAKYSKELHADSEPVAASSKEQ